MNNLRFLALLLPLSVALAQEECKENNCTQRQKLDEIVVEASRQSSNSFLYQGSVSVIGKDALSTSTNAIEAISNTLGVDKGFDNGRQIGADFRIRGFGYQSENRVIIMQDGISRSPSLFSNHISSFRSDPDILQAIEVVKGTSSILHGSGAIGGIVAMRTKDARDFLGSKKNIGTMLGARYESNKMHSQRGAFYGKNKDLDILAYAKIAKFGDITLAGGGGRFL